MFKKLLMSLLLLTAILNATDPTEESVAELYIATFDRAPDADGLEYWAKDSGLDLEEIAQSFFEQEETQLKYPPETYNSEFITAVYVNLFNHKPDEGGLDYWSKEIRTGNISRSLFILAVITGAQGYDAMTLDNKTEVGLAFARDGRNDAHEAYGIIQDITEKHESVDAALYKYGLGPNPVPDPVPNPNPNPIPIPDPPNPGPGPEYAVLFLDYVNYIGVASVHYNCDTSGDGFTKDDGRFNYYPGETCTFDLASLPGSSAAPLFIDYGVDNPASGIPYDCSPGGSAGTTDGQGEFIYQANDSCSFDLP